MSRTGGALEGRASDEWTRSYLLASGGEVQIVGAVGAIDVRGSSGSTVEVRAERVARAHTERAARELLPRIAIREDISPDKIVIQTQGLAGLVIGVQVEINYHVAVPAAALVRARTAAGGINISGVAGRVIASSANGEVVGSSLRGAADMRAVNGRVALDLEALGDNPIELRATNGGIELTLPSGANAYVIANCTNGRIEVDDLHFEPAGDQTRRRARGRINGGGTPIELTAINGNIHISPRP
jgi:hypothetical protein